jgi:hypothetical protein
MPVPMLTVLVSCRRMLLGLLVLPVGVMVGRLMMMVCGSVMVRSGLVVVLDSRVFRLVCHGLVLLKGFGETGAHRSVD